jgi:hypothetical protein
VIESSYKWITNSDGFPSCRAQFTVGLFEFPEDAFSLLQNRYGGPLFGLEIRQCVQLEVIMGRHFMELIFTSGNPRGAPYL